MNIQLVLGYLTKHCRVATLPSFEDFRGGMDTEEDISFPDGEEGGEVEFLTDLVIPSHLRGKKNGDARQIARHLWGGEQNPSAFYDQLSITDVQEYSRADHKPLKVTTQIGSLERRFFAKPFDARRMIGLELFHLLSPDKYNFSTSGESIYEAEVPGLEAEDFEEEYPGNSLRTRAYAEELIRADYLVQALLLGDMHNRNYLVVENKERDDITYTVRPIDFDKIFLIDNIEHANILRTNPRKEIIRNIGPDSYADIREFAKGEIRKRCHENESRLQDLMTIIGQIPECGEKLNELAQSLAIYHNNPNYLDARNMGQVLDMHLRDFLRPAA